MRVPSGSFEQMVCTREFNHSNMHRLVPIDSPEGQAARNNFRE